MSHPSLFDAAPHPAEALAAFAELAASDQAESLLAIAERCANAILTAQGTMAVWEVRIGLGLVGKLANDGKETLDGLGMLGTRMGLVACGRERPPTWVSAHLPKSHLNVNTRWRRPNAEERAEQAARAQDRAQSRRRKGVAA
jgi:hypothetical protein